MRTEKLRINQLSPEGYEWYLTYLEALDAKDPERYGSFLADDCVLMMNNADPVEGRATVVEGLSQYWATFGSLEHDLLNIYGNDSAFMLEALNHYTRLDGKPVTLRAVALTDRNRAGDLHSALHGYRASLCTPQRMIGRPRASPKASLQDSGTS